MAVYKNDRPQYSRFCPAWLPKAVGSFDEKGEKVRDIGSDTTAFRIEIMDADGANRRRLKLAGARFVFIGSLGDW